MDTVDDEIAAYIVRNNVGLFTYVQLTAVCKRLRHICRSDESLLVSVALYAGGLTRKHFKGLFALSLHECKKFPHEMMDSAWQVGTHAVYGEDAVHMAVRAVGGVAGWRARVAARAQHAVVAPPPPQWPNALRAIGSRQWEREEDLHWSCPRPAELPVGYTVPPAAGPVPRLRCKRRRPDARA